MRVRASIEINGQCPYCGYSWSIELHDVRGQNFAERCLDCGELFVVETAVSVVATVHALSGVDRDAVLDRLVARAMGARLVAEAMGAREAAAAPEAAEAPADPCAVEPPAGPAGPEPEKSAASGDDASAPSKANVRTKTSIGISYDDRTRIRTRYQKALEDALIRGRSRVPKKLVRELAAEFNVSESDVEAIGNNRDSF